MSTTYEESAARSGRGDILHALIDMTGRFESCLATHGKMERRFIKSVTHTARAVIAQEITRQKEEFQITQEEETICTPCSDCGDPAEIPVEESG